MEKQRTTFFIEVEKIRLLKSKLALIGKSVSQWIKEQIDKYLAEN